MPRIKIPRKSTAIDMTAMCDVAFLLLTFFILTATARQPEALPVDTPASTTKMPLPDVDVATLTVGGGQIFFGTKGQNVRERMLEIMGEQYGISFTPEEKTRFKLMENFGVPLGNLKQVIAMSTTDRIKPGVQKGIPTDTTETSELYKWIRAARVATKEINNTSLRFSIKGDAKEEYPTIQQVIKILQMQEINKFSLITSLRGLEK
jgi:biopolymer transport protein ExbD